MEFLDAVQIKRHRLTVEQYHRMLEAGVIAPEARVELIEGNVVEMAPIGGRHHAALIRLTRLLTQALDGRAIVSNKLAIRLDEMTETRPDLAIFKPTKGSYSDVLPTGSDVLLVIEVSDTKLDYDVRVKGPLYARHGVPAYWIFDLPARALRRFRLPRADAYSEVMALETPDVVTLPGLDVRVDLAGVL
ncbi:MAG: Uma2 family endonuclease, partial [Burkholderiaceae bacterium]